MPHLYGVGRVGSGGGCAGGGCQAGGHELEGELARAGRVVLGQHGLLRAAVQPKAVCGHEQVGEARREIAAHAHVHDHQRFRLIHDAMAPGYEHNSWVITRQTSPQGVFSFIFINLVKGLHNCVFFCRKVCTK